ncbi:MAG: CRISPR-associated helicase Cas3' [Verrucomicrobia bacterium]|nr:CRISPR-associated helicase Cas3' [Verrucomicrobiota bacterium]
MPHYAHSKDGAPPEEWQPGEYQEQVAHYRPCDGKVQYVESHLSGVSSLTKTYSGKVGLEACGAMVGLLHDFGKYSDRFRFYIQSAVGLLNSDDPNYLNPAKWKGKVDHASAGAQWVWNHLNSSDVLSCLVKELLALCVCSHHGGLIDCLDVEGTDRLVERMNKSDGDTHYAEACEKADKLIIDRIEELRDSDLSGTLKPLLDKIKTQATTSMLCMFWIGLLVRYVFSCVVDADRTDTADFENPEDASLRFLGKYPHWKKLVDCFETHVSGFKPDSEMNLKRCAISDACLKKSESEQGLRYLTVPTGGGKTLASMRFALHHALKHELDRIIYVIPYTSIIEQNAQEIRDVFSKNKSLVVDEIILEHHSNLLEKNDTKRNRLLSENWDAPIVFTTSVQLLEALFGGGTRGARRMHQLARSVIIFDEVQTIPINTVHLFNNAINFLTTVCSSTVIFCTATQPLLHAVDPKKGAVPYSPQRELVPYESLFKAFRRIEVVDARIAGGWSVSDVGKRMETQLEELGSVLFIANTKKDAKLIFDETEGLVKHRYHLSTSMCPAHRLEILRRVKICLRRRWPVVCVSTQLIEAGVNLDFGCVFRALAGLDSIAQAAGRCNRNNRREIGRVFIVNLTGEKLDKLPEIQLAQKEALRVLDDFKVSPESFGNDLISPKAIELYYQYYFYQRAGEMDYRVKAKDFGRDDTLLSLLSTNRLSVQEAQRTGRAEPNRVLNQAFKSAGKYFKVIDAPTEGIIVLYKGFGKTEGEAEVLIGKLAAVFDLAEQRKLLKKAQRYSVNIFPYMRQKLDAKKVLYETQPGSGIWFLDEQYYSSDSGVCTEAVEEMGFKEA